MTTGETAAVRPVRSPLRRPSVVAVREWAEEHEALVVAAFVAVLLGMSAFVRAGGLKLSFWIDEGLSVGISSHAFTSIPTVLQQDGSPPFYYLLLHVWMRLFGDGVVATHILSFAIGLLCVPAALWAGSSLFGRRAGLVAATVAAFNPFITGYSTESRMYVLIVLLGIVTTAAFVHVFVFRRRRYLPLFAGGMLVMLYTHNWSIFLALGYGAVALALLARAPDRRAMVRDGAIAVAVVGLLYAPWVPTLLFQLHHTGAPWSPGSTYRAATQIPQGLFGGGWHTWVLCAGAALGVVQIARRRRGARRLDWQAARAVLGVLAITIVAAWVASKISPAWATRYFATFLGPALLVVAIGLARASWAGLAVLAVVLSVWAQPFRPHRDAKSNARPAAVSVAHFVRAGDLALVTHPEQVPVLHYYLPPGLRYATDLGPVSDPRVMDWRDALSRLRATRPATNLYPLLARLPAGRRVALLYPVLLRSALAAPWTKLVRTRTLQWRRALAHDHSLRRLATQPRIPQHGSRGTRLRAVVYVKMR